MAQTKSTNKTPAKKTSPAKAQGGKGQSSGRPAPKNAPANTNTKNTAKAAKKPNSALHRGIGAAVCIFLGLFSFIGYSNVDAWFIVHFCGFIKGLIGWGYYIFPPMLLVCAFTLIVSREKNPVWNIVAALLTPVFFGALFHLFSDLAELELSGAIFKTLYTTGKLMESGGVISGLLAVGFRAAFSIYGAFPVILIGLVFFALNSVGLTIPKLFRMFKQRREQSAAMAGAYDYGRDDEYEYYEPEELPAKGKGRGKGKTHQAQPQPAEVQSEAVPAEPPRRRRRRAIDIPIDEVNVPDENYQEERVGFFNTKPRVRTPDQVLEQSLASGQKDNVVTPLTPEMPEEYEAPAAVDSSAPLETPIRRIEPEPVTATENVKPMSIEEAAAVAGVSVISSESAKPAAVSKKIRADEVAAEAEEISNAFEMDLAEASGEYTFPPVELLKGGGPSTVDGREEVALNRDRLESTIHSFGVSANITGVTRGPTVTRYDLELDQGVKLAKLTNLAGDLALSLGVSNVRIAPIPDKISTVGVEVPNKLVSTVYLRDIIDSPAFKNAQSKLSFAIGKDIGGNPIVGNIAKLPHLLIAGTTGSGKSVCMNSLILSLLYKSTPEEVRLIMIDPKMVELGIYNGIPHLFVPVVTDPKKAAGALQWAVVEMLKRYRLFSEIGVRDLAGYNNHQKNIGEPTMPRVVIVIDELADLMLVASKEVEESICRVAQMGRASGMHLVIATQRPSADVITGLMKANIPSRIAFAVSSAMESRIILDNGGAEKLIGAGDMLYAPLGVGKPMRVQGAFVSDDEREQVINFIKQSGEAEYSEDILAQIERAAEDKDSGNGGKSSAPEDAGESSNYDELLPQAVEVIFETKQASVSMLQRRLKLGYARAARIVDQMEEVGVVGPFEGSKPRQILITKQQWDEMQSGGSGAPADKAAGGEMDDQVSFADFTDTPAEEWKD